MSELKSPVQPFIVRHKGTLSALQMQSLIQLYQPIIGGAAVNFYLLLMQQHVNELKISQQRVHSSLFPYFGGGLKAIDEARLRLEAIGLIQTYKQTNLSLQARYATLMYDMQYPLLLSEFLESPVLTNALISQIGDIEFYDIVKQWEIAPIEIAEYEEVSVSFSTVFSHPHNDYQTIVEGVKAERQLMEDAGLKPDPSVLETFDYARVMRKLMAEKVSHQLINPKLKEELQALHIVYGLNESQIVTLVLRHYQPTNQTIDYPAIKLAAQKVQVSNRESQVNTNSSDRRGQSSIVDIATGKSSTPSTVPTANQIKKDYPQLSDSDIALIQLCHQYQPEAVLDQIKKNRNGFVSSQELSYLKNIARISQLSKSVQSFLVYYLLNIKKRTDYQKGESERVANEWQQNNIQSVAQALVYVRQQAKNIALKQKQRENARQSTKNNYRQANKRVEQQPYWLKQNQSTSHSSQIDKKPMGSQGTTQNQSEPLTKDQNAQPMPKQTNDGSQAVASRQSNPQTEAQLRSRLGKLFEKGRDQ